MSTIVTRTCDRCGAELVESDRPGQRWEGIVKLAVNLCSDTYATGWAKDFCVPCFDVAADALDAICTDGKFGLLPVVDDGALASLRGRHRGGDGSLTGLAVNDPDESGTVVCTATPEIRAGEPRMRSMTDGARERRMRTLARRRGLEVRRHRGRYYVLDGCHVAAGWDRATGEFTMTLNDLERYLAAKED